jgi:hypothetical protein
MRTATTIEHSNDVHLPQPFYVINRRGFYFSVFCDIDLINITLLKSFGCQIFDCQKVMYTYICEKQRFGHDKVNGNDICLTPQDPQRSLWMHTDSRGCGVSLDLGAKSIERYIIDYEL